MLQLLFSETANEKTRSNDADNGITVFRFQLQAITCTTIIPRSTTAAASEKIYKTSTSALLVCKIVEYFYYTCKKINVYF